jgi:hypothetical protein
MNKIQGLPDLPIAECGKVDGIQPFSQTDQAKRLNQGPRWHNNSCAIDCALFLLLSLDAGRCQADQVSDGVLQQQNDAAKTILSVIRKPWSRLSPNDIDKMRDIIREELQRLDSDRYRIGDFQAVSAVLEDLAASAPQFWATWGTMVQCCPNGVWQWRLNRNGLIKKSCQMGLHMSHDLVNELQEAADIQHLLNPTLDLSTNTAQYARRCTRGCSEGGPQTQRVLLDRPPPTLVLKGIERSEGFLKGLFNDLNLEFKICTARGLQVISTRYVFWACIIF